MKKQFAAECRQQQINPAHTVYKWELSLNGTDFHHVMLDTVFTSSKSRVLQPVYLEPGMFVRCSAWAVGRDHTRGHSRSSHPSQLSDQQLCEGRGSEEEALLVSYPHFSGTAEVCLKPCKTFLSSFGRKIPLFSKATRQNQKQNHRFEAHTDLSLRLRPGQTLSFGCTMCGSSECPSHGVYGETVHLSWYTHKRLCDKTPPFCSAIHV